MENIKWQRSSKPTNSEIPIEIAADDPVMRRSISVDLTLKTFIYFDNGVELVYRFTHIIKLHV